MTEKLTDRKYDKIPFRLHPRVFSSLGSDLVTNDVVAIIELVKNSYDANATKVDIRVVNEANDSIFCFSFFLLYP